MNNDLHIGDVPEGNSITRFGVTAHLNDILEVFYG